MRAPHGNLLFQGTAGSDSLDFGDLANTWNGVDYVTLGGNDKVTGTIFDDTFTLGKDAEFIDGDSGWDTVIYANSTAGVQVDLNNVTQHGGFAEGDQLQHIENVTGSQFDDTLIGTGTANTLDGQGGNDKIVGGDGDDTLLGGDGKDYLYGDAGRDVLHGGTGEDVLNGGTGDDQFFGDAGDDIMRGGAGIDAYDGGDGVDTVDYSAAPSSVNNSSINGVYVNLSTGSGAFGDADGDTYVNVENVRGSAYDDYLFGDANDNAFYGNGGDDVITGGAGADHLDGGSGNNWLSYTFSSAGVSVDLASNQASGGDANGDTILNFQNVYGSSFVDSLLGSDVGNEIVGHGGNDTLVGRGGNDRIEGDAGNDFMIGGADADTFVFIAVNTSFAGGPQQGNDVIADFAVGTDHLEFTGNAVDSLSDLHFVQSGGNTIITYNDGHDPASITLVGVNTMQLLAHAQTDFLFT